MEYDVSLSEEQRQLLLMALADLACARPGWDSALSDIALKFDRLREGRPALYEDFIRLRREEAFRRLGGP
jgi:hypothetical protein